MPTTEKLSKFKSSKGTRKRQRVQEPAGSVDATFDKRKAIGLKKNRTRIEARAKLKKRSDKRQTGEQGRVPANATSEKKSKRKNGEFVVKVPRLIIRNVPFSLTEETLKERLLPFGEVKECHFPERKGGLSPGFVFVQFARLSDAAKCIEKLNGKSIEGRTVAVDWCLPKDVYDKSSKSRIDLDEVTETTKVDMDLLPDPERSDELKQREKRNKRKAKDGVSKPSDVADGTAAPADQTEQERKEHEEDGPAVDDLGGSDTKKPRKVDSSKRPEQADDVAKRHEETFLKGSKDVQEGQTVFLSNLSLHTSEQGIEEVLSKFGPIVYVKIVRDKITGRSRGSAFVRFRSKETADTVVDSCAQTGGTIPIDYSEVRVSIAVPRAQLEAKKQKKAQQEGTRSSLADDQWALATAGDLHPREIEFEEDAKKRQQLRTARNAKLKRPAEYFVSSTRLVIHNLPYTFVDNVQLRRIVLNAAGDPNAHVTECKIMMKEKPTHKRMGQVSRGHAFVALDKHEHALAVLRNINNNPHIFPKMKRRPIVEFSIENRRALRLKAKRAAGSAATAAAASMACKK